MRLAIQAPSPEGNQPVVSADGRFVLVFNGEAYNFSELRHRYGLQPDGSDAHVVLQLWQSHGPAALRLLRGMFALAVVDCVENTVTLARDRFGIKPLYYSLQRGTLQFASELRTLAAGAAGHGIDRAALARFLHYGAIDAGGTPLDGIRLLAPGSTLTVGFDDRGHATVSAEGRFATEPAAGARSDATEAAEAFVDSVRAHLVSDVPVALLLSAGVDSTLIALAASRLGQRLHCLTVDGQGMAAEYEHAARTARHYRHTSEQVTAELSAAALDQFVCHLQRPSIDGLNTFLVSSAVHAAGFRVALSGLGGDEALAGYSHARLLPYLRALRWSDHLPDPAKLATLRLAGKFGRCAVAPKAARLLLRGGPRAPAELSALQRELFAPPVIAALLDGTPLPSEPTLDVPTGVSANRAWALAERALYLESMLLPDSDAFSMAHSVELRVPFIDGPFFDTAQAMPARVGRATGKARLVAAMDDPYVSALAKRPKRGFSLPMAPWMLSGPLRDAVLDARRADAPVWDLLDRTVGIRHLDDTTIRRRWAEAWALTVLDLWLRRHHADAGWRQGSAAVATRGSVSDA